MCVHKEQGLMRINDNLIYNDNYVYVALLLWIIPVLHDYA